jgi:hypothetical protein
VLSCSSPLNTGTQTNVGGSIDFDALPTSGTAEAQIRINDPAGPLFVAGPNGRAGYATADWVRNGMEFFLTAPAVPGVALASQRAYLLSIRDCAKPDATPAPAIRATRDCAKTDTFTLAFYTGEQTPVEIRQDSVDGPAVARLPGVSGLVDVMTSRPAAYHLMKFEAGKWKSLASAVADPGQRCEQGRTSGSL